MTKITFVTQWFDPEPAYRGLSFAQQIADFGFDVDVVTGFPNYPGGAVYDGYRIRPWQREFMEGIDVLRLPLWPSHSTSRLGRILNYVSFFLSVWVYLTFRMKKTDLIYVYHPPITVGFAVALAQLVRRTPMVLEIQDMWPDTLSSTGMLNNKRILSVIGRVCLWVYGRCCHIIVQSPGFHKTLIDRNVSAEKLTTILGWTDEAGLATAPKHAPKNFPQTQAFQVLFAGNMGHAQALETALDAAALLKDSTTPIKFYFIGGGIDRSSLEKDAQARGLDNVVFLPRVSPTEIGSYLSAADALLVHLRDDPLFEMTIPSKIPAYLATGRPILVGVRGDAADLIDHSGAGLAFAPQDPEALKDAVLALAQKSPTARADMGAQGKAFYDEKLSQSVGLEQFGALFSRLTS